MPFGGDRETEVLNIGGGDGDGSGDGFCDARVIVEDAVVIPVNQNIEPVICHDGGVIMTDTNVLTNIDHNMIDHTPVNPKRFTFSTSRAGNFH